MTVFSWIIDLLIPSMMILIGYIFLFHTPKKINYFYGYRTHMSMKSEETWKYAHHKSGKLMLILGLLASLSIIITKLLIPQSSEILNLIYIGTGLLLFIVIIIIVEIDLRNKFDKDGQLR